MNKVSADPSGVILVTGARGFIGAPLVKGLRSAGISVIAASRSAQAGTAAEPLVRRYEELDLEGVSCIVHLGARVHVMSDFVVDPLMEFRRANVETTLNLAKRAAESNVKRFVFISSVKVHGESTQIGRALTEEDVLAPLDAYGISKAEAEQCLNRIALETGLEVVIVRPPLVYGPGVRANLASMLRAVRDGWPLPLGAIRNLRSLVGLDNLLDFIATCATHPGAANQTFLVSDGQDVSTPDLIRGLAHAAGVPARLFSVPLWALHAGGKLFDRRMAIDRLCGNLQVDISKARSQLGWSPPVSVQEGLWRAVTGSDFGRGGGVI